MGTSGDENGFSVSMSGVEKWVKVVLGSGNGFSVSMSGVEKWAQVVMEMGFQ